MSEEKTIAEKLDEPVAPQFIKKLPATEKRPALDYVPAHYVVAGLNKLFGYDNWEWSIVSIDKTGEQHEPWVCHGRITVTDGEHMFYREGIGCDTDPKSAESDAIKRAARLIGRKLGMSLYE